MSERRPRTQRFKTSAKRDLLLILLAVGVTYGLASTFDLFEWLTSVTRAQERWRLDGVISSLALLAIALGVFGVRRWLELNAETRQRLIDLDELAASEARYRNLVEVPSLGVMLLDLAGRYVYVNPKMEELTGYTPEEFYSDTRIGWRLTRREDHRSGLLAVQNATRGTTTTNVEFRLIHKNGETRWAAGSCFPVFDADGAVRGVEVIVIDITTSKRLEERLRQSQKMEAIGQLGAGVAHNFNNLLQGILGCLELAASGPASATRRYLSDAMAMSLRGAAIVKQLMLLTRQHGGEETVVFDLGSVIQDVVQVCSSTFDPRITIDSAVGESVSVAGDRAQIEQVFLNLCLNARDAMARSRHPSPSMAIDVDLQSISDGNCAGSGILERSGTYVRTRITDQGIGMDEETQRRAFEPFFTTKEVGKGTGLGLSTAYGIVEQHGGWIECDSNLGQGTVFSVFLPVAPATETLSPAPPTRPSHALERGSETILLIDDEETVRTTIARMLRRVGYTVLESADGRDGLALFDQERARIDLILLDLSMPHMSGEEVLEELRARDADIAIVLLTGHEPDEQLMAHVHGVITKPVPFLELSDEIQAVLDRQSSRRPAS